MRGHPLFISSSSCCCCYRLAFFFSVFSSRAYLRKERERERGQYAAYEYRLKHAKLREEKRERKRVHTLRPRLHRKVIRAREVCAKCAHTSETRVCISAVCIFFRARAQPRPNYWIRAHTIGNRKKTFVCFSNRIEFEFSERKRERDKKTRRSAPELARERERRRKSATVLSGARRRKKKTRRNAFTFYVKSARAIKKSGNYSSRARLLLTCFFFFSLFFCEHPKLDFLYPLWGLVVTGGKKDKDREYHHHHTNARGRKTKRSSCVGV